MASLQDCPIARLPDELLATVLSRVPTAQLAQVAPAVCRRWAELLAGPCLAWARLTLGIPDEEPDNAALKASVARLRSIGGQTTSLTLRGRPCREVVAAIAALPRLQEFDRPLTSRDGSTTPLALARAVLQHPSMRRASITLGPEVSVEAIAGLGACCSPALRALSLCLPIVDATDARPARLEALRSFGGVPDLALRCQGAHYSPSSAPAEVTLPSAVCALQNLTQLAWRVWRVSIHFSARPAGLSAVTALEVICREWGRIQPALEAMPQLVSLTVMCEAGCEICLPALERLAALHITGRGGDFTLRAAGPLPSLTRLHLCDCRGLHQLLPWQGLPRLERLWIQGGGDLPAAAACCAAQLTELRVSNGVRNWAGFARLADRLRVLHIDAELPMERAELAGCDLQHLGQLRVMTLCVRAGWDIGTFRAGCGAQEAHLADAELVAHKAQAFVAECLPRQARFDLTCTSLKLSVRSAAGEAGCQVLLGAAYERAYWAETLALMASGEVLNLGGR